VAQRLLGDCDPAGRVDRLVALSTAPALVFARGVLRNCGAINHTCEDFRLLYSCCLYVDQKLIISAYQG
jgi:hypothetical protein